MSFYSESFFHNRDSVLFSTHSRFIILINNGMQEYMDIGKAINEALLLRIFILALLWLFTVLWIKHISLPLFIIATICLSLASLYHLVFYDLGIACILYFLFLTLIVAFEAVLLTCLLCLSAIVLLPIGIVIQLIKASVSFIAVLVQATVRAVFLAGMIFISPDFIWSKLFVFRPPRYRRPGPVCEAECRSQAGSLYERCSDLIRESALLTGTACLFTSPVETHNHYRAAGLRESNSKCHLCNLLYLSSKLAHSRMDETQYGAISSNDNDRGLEVAIHRIHELGARPRLFLQLDPNTTPGAKALVVQQVYGGSKYKCAMPCKTDSPRALNLAKQWIQSCSKRHSVCRHLQARTDRPFLPNRLIRILSLQPENVKVRLIETEQECQQTTVEYLALSHCWGKNTFLTLKQEKLGEFKTLIPFKDLARNFQDAIRITARLGFEYLWIDCMCILQDDKEDWRSESANMGRIYANAACTISATASRDANGGCSYPRQALIADCVLGTQPFSALAVKSPISDPNGLDNLFDEKIESAPISSRGWTFQERVLSKRVLHFSDGVLFFECNTHLASEFHPDGVRHVKLKYNFSIGRLLTMAFQMIDHSVGYIGMLAFYAVLIIERFYLVLALPVLALLYECLDALLHPLRRAFKRDITPRESLSRYINQRFSPGGLLPRLENSVWEERPFPELPKELDNRVLPGFIGKRRAFQALLIHPLENWTEIEKFEFHQQWMELVGPYSARDLSLHTDRLVALIGVASFIKEATGTQFLAGLWKISLAWNMIWQCKTPNEKRPEREVPTWSWAAVDGEVTDSFTPDKISARETVKFRNTLGEVNYCVDTDKWKVHVLEQHNELVYRAEIEINGGACYLIPFSIYLVEHFSPDVIVDLDESLFCLPIFVIRDRKEQEHGIVLRKVTRLNENSYERVGYYISRPNKRKSACFSQCSICLV